MKKIHFVISGLGGGGAERMLLKLLSRIDRGRFEPQVISLTEYGEISKDLARRFENINVPVRFLGMQQGVPDPRGVIRLSQWFWVDRPDLVQTWMYHADLIGGISAKIARRIPVVWNIRHSDLRPGVNKKTTIWTARICSRLSYILPSRIICCGFETKKVHESIGYDKRKMIVIQNGFDADVFRKIINAREKVAKELNIPGNDYVIGMVARYDYQKDHNNFIESAAILSMKIPNVTFILCGDLVNVDNQDLNEKIYKYNLKDKFRLLGHRNDIPEIVSSFDIATSSSSCGEGFPNSVGEAMACEAVCVVTDVGDSRFIVGDHGRVVPPKDPQSLASGWFEILKMDQSDRIEMGRLARQRILDEFSLDVITQKYENIYSEVLNIQ